MALLYNFFAKLTNDCRQLKRRTIDRQDFLCKFPHGELSGSSNMYRPRGRFSCKNNGTVRNAGCEVRLPGAQLTPAFRRARMLSNATQAKTECYLTDSEYMEQNSWTRIFRASRSSLKYKGLNMRILMASRGVMGLPLFLHPFA